jgi:transposase-like protein
MLLLICEGVTEVPRGRKKRKLSVREPGRPTDYRPEMCEQVQQWVQDGIVNHEIAARLGIDEATLYRWKNEYCEFCEAFQRGHNYRHQNVVNALYKRCIGYEYTETTKEPADEKTGDPSKPVKTKMVITKKVKKQVAPDTGAIEFYLTNKCPNEYKHKTEVHSNITGDVVVKKEVDLSNLSDEELDQLERIISKASNS